MNCRLSLLLILVLGLLQAPALVQLAHPIDRAGLRYPGVTIKGIDVEGYMNSVSCAGDVNGDGFFDFLIGACEASPDGKVNAGKTYLIYGSAAGIGSLGVLDPQKLDGKNGVMIKGRTTDDMSGKSVSGAGDLNGEGDPNIVVGAPGASPDGKEDAGETYLIYGSSAGIGSSGVLDLNKLNEKSGVLIRGKNSWDFSGVTGDRSGVSVSGAGDVNGDGY